MEQSEAINDLAAALAKAQGQIEGAAKAAENPAFKRDGKAMKYADLTAVWNACRDVLSEHGLAVIQAPGLTTEGRMTMTTMLVHSSGQWVRETLSIPLAKQDPQGYGSAVTYARRYALQSFIGIAPEDDDGNAASAPAPRREPERKAEPRTQQAQGRSDTRAQNGDGDGIDLKAHWTDWAGKQAAMFERATRTDLAEWQETNREKASVCLKYAPKAHARMMELFDLRLDDICIAEGPKPEASIIAAG